MTRAGAARALHAQRVSRAGRVAPWIAFALALARPGPARCADAPLGGLVSELRVGVLSHDMLFPNREHLRLPNPFRHRFEGGVNVSGEVIFVSPDFLRAIGAPRPRLGGSFNTAKLTDNVYVDLDWGLQLRWGPFAEGFLGAAWHDGEIRRPAPPRPDLGARILFHLGVELGWRWHRHGLSLVWEHMSNGNLARRNQGLDSSGLRYGYRFD